MSMGQNSLLSLVITSYTTERLGDIYELLESIKNQTYKNMETIFVAERSHELYEKVKAYAEEKSVPNMKVIFNGDRPGLSAARNLGIEKAEGEIVAFVDDDVVLFSDWAEKMVEALENNSAIGVTGAAFPLWENESLKWLPEEFYWLISCTAWTGWKEPRIVRGVFGSNMAFKRDAFADGCLFSVNAGFSHGHRDKPISEDIEFSLRLKKRTGKHIMFNPNPRVWHRVIARRLSLRFVVQRAHHVGCTRRIIRRYYADEFGSFDQENKVLKGILKLLIRIPREFIVKPVLAWKELSLIVEILVSAAVGFMIPIPSYSLDKERVGS